jgi:LacI family transcriptional regulator
MRDIASKLGVSTVTVSMALGGKEGVSKSVREKIQKKAEELGYTYNSLPRSMLKGRNYSIGIFIAARFLGESSFYWTFFQRLITSLRKTEYMGVLEIVDDADEASLSVPAIVAAKRIDGAILLGQLSDEYLSMITDQMPACVFLDFYSDIGKCDCVASNNFLGSYNLTKLLIAAGHKKIAFIGSTQATTSILDRYMGFCKAMLEVNLPFDDAIADRDSKGTLFSEIKINPSAYSACVCNSDRLAGVLVRQLIKKQIMVPRDISIVGFDNESETITAGIGVTSLEVDNGAMCDLAVDFLVQRIENDDYTPRGRSFVDGRIIIKNSIAAPLAKKRIA